MSNLTAEQSLTCRRLAGEITQLAKTREPYYQVIQDKTDPFTFHFCYHNDVKTDPYYGGYYIGKIILPNDYPKTPGNFYMSTPNGRFDINAKICLTNSGYHKENWTPMWNLANMVVGFVSIFTSDDTKGISHIKETTTQRKAKAADSVSYNMTHHKDITLGFTQFFKPDGTPRTNEEIKEWIIENKPTKSSKKRTGTDKNEKTVRVKKVTVESDTKQNTTSTTTSTITPTLSTGLNPNPIQPEPIKKWMMKPKLPSKKIIKDDISDDDVPEVVTPKNPNIEVVESYINLIKQNPDVKQKNDEEEVITIGKKTRVDTSKKMAIPKVVAPKVVVPKDIPKVVAPKVVVPKDIPKVVAPKVVAPKVVAPKVVAPKDIPKVVAPKVVAPKDIPKVVAKTVKIEKEVVAPKKTNIIVVKKRTVYPTNYQDWRKMISESTLATHDPALFQMVFPLST